MRKGQLLDNGELKHVCVARNMHAIIHELLGVVSSVRFVPWGGGFENILRSPASLRRRRKGNPVTGSITRPPCSWAIKMREEPCPPGWGSLKSETVKCGHESRETRIREWLGWRRPSPIVKTDPYSCQRGCYIRTITASVQLEKKYWSWVSRGLSPRRNDWR
jgi:hypothetical protein